MARVKSCPSCATPASEQSRFCAICGTPIIEDGETRLVTTPPTRPRSTPRTGFSAPDTDFDHGRFLPGTTLAGRYRILGRIGRGGMGEVYQADDLRLGQQVALKFLPEEVSNDAGRLSQFHAEVRLARLVSHPNVCRVYDIGEDDGRTFLSMEYIDGEDLASLLRRIGRLPQDKALELSRQLCAGLAAAHERGVVHRDLKPGNLMIDGEGRVRLTDFGIAALAAGGGPAAGTPGYMAPELLSGAPATLRSDIYALGLVLYELFTAKKAFAHGSLAEVVRAQQETHPTSPSAYVPDLDPAIDRAILRCLRRDPEQRPASALSVSAMLPGGDPLAAALAAGETPSPEMVAAAGEAEAIAPGRGAALVVVALLAALGTVLIADRTFLANLLPLDKPPAVLADRAASILDRAGYSARFAQASGFVETRDYLEWVLANNKSPDRWKELRNSRGPSISYWFRVSPRMLVPTNLGTRPGFHDPPMNISGQAGVLLDTRGRLIELHGVPPQYDEESTAPAAVDWQPLFDAAGLDMARFTPTTPRWTPRVYADARAAWTGTVPEHPGVTLRVEAATYRGKPVFFALPGPWTRPSRMIERTRSRLETLLSFFSRVVVVSVFTGALLLAWRNTRRGRGDRQGAKFAAGLMFVLSFGHRVLRMWHVSDAFIESERFFVIAVALPLFDAGMMWVVYMAVEPAIRRFWPDLLKGWSRLVSGRLRDPRVGRDLLYGTVAGMALAVIGTGHDLIVPLLGSPPPIPTQSDTSVWLGAEMTLGSIFMVGRNAFQNVGITLFVVVLMRMLLRHRLLAIVATILISSVVNVGQVIGSETPILDAAFTVALVGFVVIMVVQLGLLSGLVMFFSYAAITSPPLTSSFSSWYGQPGGLAVLLVVVLACGGFWLARGDAPLFGRPILEE